MDKKLVIISGPSGAGKDTIVETICKLDSSIYKIRTSTTRGPRPGEVNGVDYDFWDKDLFLDAVNFGLFLEYNNVHGNYYGTPLESVQVIEDGATAILILDVQGALEVMPKVDAVTIFITPPSIEELEKRIRQRGLDKEDAIQTRLLNAQQEMDCSGNYQYIVVNDTLSNAVSEILTILDKESLAHSYKLSLTQATLDV